MISDVSYLILVLWQDSCKSTVLNGGTRSIDFESYNSTQYDAFLEFFSIKICYEIKRTFKLTRTDELKAFGLVAPGNIFKNSSPLSSVNAEQNTPSVYSSHLIFSI